MGQSQFCLLDLPCPSLALELLIDLVQHAQPTGTDGVTKRFEAAISIDRELAFKREDTIVDGRSGLTFLDKAKVFINQQLGDGEAIMHFCQADLLKRLGNPSLLVGLLRGTHSFREVDEVVGQDPYGPYPVRRTGPGL